MNAEIITIGDEILIGQIVDTNSQWIGKELNKIGVSVYQISSIQDEEQHILNAFYEAQTRADIVIITGGLGPTKDDITKKTIAKFFNDQEVVEYPEVIDHIRRMFKKYNIPYTKVQQFQAQLPSKARLLMNQMGTAPGMWFYENNTVFVSMPGIPYEMKGLMKHEVIPRIQEQFKLPFIIHKTVMTYGQGESIIAERIESWANKLPNFIKLAYLPSFGRVRLRLSAKGPEKQVLEDRLDSVLQELYVLLSDIITGHESGVSIEEHIGNLLKDSGKTLCTAESVTGGKIASTLVSVAGSSLYFNGGIVAYSSKMKQDLLGIPDHTIKKYSVVSAEVVEAMAISARKKTNSDYAIAVSGNAGPSSDNTSTAVGVVFIAIASAKGVQVKEFNFGHPREKVINRTVNKSLQMLQQEILKK
ncbi:CinA family nicotinamide mononucleotide deamidase-related protein [Flavobacteriaceae bacterium]|jgi:nicotinamide-nucleotide amidase|nr:CinA family nicotinamide mononucleotide deamidase-related protein [Flavobacteriaceae bacterium]MDC3318909.1 CinA family nicotinamide mononucleotide deamidase-related protein [Flavobacteriaceae bacterium]